MQAGRWILVVVLCAVALHTVDNTPLPAIGPHLPSAVRGPRFFAWTVLPEVTWFTEYVATSHAYEKWWELVLEVACMLTTPRLYGLFYGQFVFPLQPVHLISVCVWTEHLLRLDEGGIQWFHDRVRGLPFSWTSLLWRTNAFQLWRTDALHLFLLYCGWIHVETVWRMRTLNLVLHSPSLRAVAYSAHRQLIAPLWRRYVPYRVRRTLRRRR